MTIHKGIILAAWLFTITLSGHAQTSQPDSTVNNLKFKATSLVIPTALITYGLIGMESDELKEWNAEIKEELNENIDERVTIDDFSQYLPAFTVYALGALGVKGKHNFRDKSIILASSFLISSTLVSSLKSTTNVTRPDNSSNNSFPSGHTAMAFMGAEFLRQEYKDVSVWYGISGYLVAAGTGFFRMYNDRHWLTDVAAGAGIGILSTKIAYWIHPLISKTLFPGKKIFTTSIVCPYYNGKQYGLSLAMRL